MSIRTLKTEKKLTEYQAGYLDALWNWAWWKDGTAYVGSTGTTYKDAKDEFLRNGRMHADPSSRDLR